MEVRQWSVDTADSKQVTADGSASVVRGSVDTADSMQVAADGSASVVSGYS